MTEPKRQGTTETRLQAMTQSKAPYNPKASPPLGEAQFRDLIESNADGIVILDEDGILRFANAAAEELFSQDTANLIGEAFGFPVSIDVPTELNVVNRDGEVAFLEMRMVKTVWDAEAVYIASLRDITERKRSEEKLHVALQKTKDLYEISRRISSVYTLDDVLRALLASSILEFATQGYLYIFNHPWQDTPPESYQIAAAWSRNSQLAEVAHSSEMFFPLKNHPFAHLFSRSGTVYIEDKRTDKRIADSVRKMLAQRKVRSAILFPLITGGKWYGMLVLYFSDPNKWNEQDDEHIHGLVDQAAIAIDNIRLLEAEAKARAKAEQADELKLKFLAMISHELRTPLTSIKGFATTLLADDVSWDIEDQREFIEIISQESDKLTELIEQLLDLSRLEAGTLRINPVQQHIRDILNLAMPQLQVTTISHSLLIDLPAALPAVTADPQRIAQVFTNLVGNAAKYSPAKTSISISAIAQDEFIEVTVSDEGPGIPLEERESVFQAFQRAATSAVDREGAGLGLAICKGMIEAHGGRIWIQDNNAVGTKISFVLPITHERVNLAAT